MVEYLKVQSAKNGRLNRLEKSTLESPDDFADICGLKLPTPFCFYCLIACYRLNSAVIRSNLTAEQLIFCKHLSI